jgi:hypothetical protein
MQYLHRYQVVSFLFILVFLMGSLSSSAQRADRGSYNYNSFKNKQYYFGITLGYNTSNYKVYRSESFLLNDTLGLVQSFQGPGFNLGLVTNLKVGNYFDIRFLPTLSFATRNINYGNAESNQTFDRKMDPVFIEAPLQFRFKSDIYNDMKMYILGGVKYVFDVSSESRTKREANLVKIAPSDFAVEFGFGCQFFFPYFILSPELKYSQGISNTLIYNSNITQATVLDKVISRTFTISFHFEG